MNLVILEAKIVSINTGAVTEIRNEGLSHEFTNDVPVDAAVQDMALRLARQIRYPDIAREQGVRLAPGDHSRMDE